MKKIECIIRPNAFETVKEALGNYGVSGMTVTNVFGCGLQLGRTEIFRGNEYTVNLLSKIKLEVVVKDSIVNDIIEIVSKAACTGKIGDGKIFVSDIENVYRIRTGETGEDAI